MKTRIIKKQILEEFARHMHNEEKSVNTMKKYLRDVRKLAEFTAGKEIKKELMIAYKQHLVDEGYAICSINSMLASVNSLLEFLGWTDCKIKFLKCQRQNFCSEEKELTKEDYFRLVHTAKRKGNTRLALLLQTICGTGIRISELQYITVEGVRKGSVVVSLKGKTRRIFIVTALQKKLLCYVEDRGIESGPVFITRNGKPVSRTNIWKEMKALCLEARVDPRKVFPHNFRHLFARCFYSVEKDIAKLADILGHSNITTTWRYLISTDKQHRKQMERLQLIL